MPLSRVAVTPRKYDVGSCVLAVVMLDFYSPEALPDRGVGPFWQNDVAAWGEVWEGFHRVIEDCEGVGWVEIGE